MQKWYAVIVKPRQGHVSASFLEQAGIETFYSEVNECFSIKGRRCVRRSGLFPSYFFAEFDYDKEYRAVSYRTGVRKIVAFCQSPAEVESSLLDDIRIRLGCQNMLPVSRLEHGKVIRISHGPLAGVEGVFDSFLSGKERVVVLLRALFYQGRAVLKASDVKRFSEAV